MTNIEGTTVCIVEDDPVLSFLLREICKASGCIVLGIASDIEGASCMLDGGDNGINLLARTKRDYPRLATVLVTGWDLGKLAARSDYVAPDYHLQKSVLPPRTDSLAG